VASSVDLERAMSAAMTRSRRSCAEPMWYSMKPHPFRSAPIDDPLSSHEVNIDGTFQVLRACATAA